MKQFDSYLLFGCHFPKKFVDIILKNSSLKFFNSKISKTYNCEIIKLNVLFSDNFHQENFFLKILPSNDSPSNIIKHEDIKDLLNEDKINKFKSLLESLDQPVIEPYLTSIPIYREL